MKVFLFYIFLMIFTYGCDTKEKEFDSKTIQISSLKNSSDLQAGKILISKDLPTLNANLILTNSSQFRPFFNITLNNLDFTVAYDNKTLEIRYIFIDDSRFVTNDSLYVGKFVKTIKEDIHALPGWEIRLPKTIDDWYPIIGYNEKIITKVNNMEKTSSLSYFTHNDKLDSIFIKIIGFSRGGN